MSALPVFDAVIARMVRKEAEALHIVDAAQTSEYARQEASIVQQIDRITGAIAEVGSSRALLEKLESLEAERDRLATERQEFGRITRAAVELPDIGRLRELATQVFDGLVRGSPEAGRLARRLIPRLEARPYRLCDGGNTVPLAHLTLDLAPLVPDARILEGRTDLLRRLLVVDLFDMAQRAAYRERVVALRAGQKSERKVAAEQGLTVTAAQKAMSLDRLVKELGITAPYVELTEPPSDQARMRRHKHARFRFEAVAGHPPQ